MYIYYILNSKYARAMDQISNMTVYTPFEAIFVAIEDNNLIGIENSLEN